MNNKTILVISTNREEGKYSNCKIIQERFANGEDTYQTMWRSLEYIFSRVIFYDYTNNLLKKSFDIVNREIVDLARSEKPDYILYHRLDEHKLYEDTMSKIRSLNNVEGSNIKTIGFFGDDASELHVISKNLIPFLDYIITIDSADSVEGYARYGAKAIFIPAGVDETRFHKIENMHLKYDVSFVGVAKYDRIEMINAIRAKDIYVETFGVGWDKGFLTHDDMVEVYNGSKINLNFTRTMGDNRHFKSRTIEIPMCGGFLLTEYIPDIEKYYKVDKEIVCFDTVDECIEKIQYYLSHEAERAQIAQNGYNVTRQNYTWTNVFSCIFDKIESGKYCNMMHDPIPLTKEDINRKLGKKLIYAMAFYIDIGKTTQYDEMISKIQNLNQKDIKASIVMFIMKFFPYIIGRKLVRALYDAYYKVKRHQAQPQN